MLNECQRTTGMDLTFWWEWQQYRDDLYDCCLRRMGGNQTEAEDALGAAMLRAREGWRTRTKPINSVKGWLVELVNNLCTDLLEERDRLAFGIENPEWVSQEEGPALAATRQELELFFEGEVNNLSPKLRETFLLHWKQELSYQEIAERSGISQETARKRISNARAILRERWNEYDGVTEGSSPSLKRRRKSKGTKLETYIETLGLGASEKLAAGTGKMPVLRDLTDGPLVGESAPRRLGEAKLHPTRNAASGRLGKAKLHPTKNAAPRRLGEAKLHPTRTELIKHSQKTRFFDISETGFLDQFSSSLGEVPLSPISHSPFPRKTQICSSRFLALFKVAGYPQIVPWVRGRLAEEVPTSQPCLKPKLLSSKFALVPRPKAVGAILANGKLSLQIKNREEKEKDTLKEYFGTDGTHPPDEQQWGVRAMLVQLLLLLPGSFVVAWQMWADSGGDSLNSRTDALGSSYNTFAKIKNAIRRLSGATAQPNKIVGFHEGPHDLQENGEGVDLRNPVF